MWYYLFCLLLVITAAKASSLYPDGRIVGGLEANILQYPYQVSIRKNGGHICGGSIITNVYVLTAAHCVYNQNAGIFTIRAGSNFSNTGGVLLNVVTIYSHEHFNNSNMDNDIAILKLQTTLQFSDSILPIALPSQGEKVAVGTAALISGWGYTKEEGSVSLKLLVVEVPIISKQSCKNAYLNENVTVSMICAGNLLEGGKDACQGDSGGPLRASGKLMGIVSWGYGCARPKLPGVYARVSRFRNWIKEKTNY